MGGIFICYRREDAAGYVHALRDRLAARLGSEQVFMDIDSIEPGLDFVEVIESSVTSCSVVLALIGKRWLQPEKLQDSRDFVRLEIQAAIEKKIRVIPVLLDGAEMPRAEALPAELASLSRRQAYEISNRHFSDDVNQLGNLIERILRDQEPKKDPPPPLVTFVEPLAVTTARPVEKPSALPPAVRTIGIYLGSVLTYLLGIIASSVYLLMTIGAITDFHPTSEKAAIFGLVLVNDTFLLAGWFLKLRRSARAALCFFSVGLCQIALLIVLIMVEGAGSMGDLLEMVGLFVFLALTFFLLAYRNRERPAQSRGIDAP